MKVDARTPQAFLIFMCLCIFRFIICPQAKVAASCPSPADVMDVTCDLSSAFLRIERWAVC